MIQDPSLPGPFTSTKVTYAAPGLSYAVTNCTGRYFVFENPTSGFTTRTIDLSDIADFDVTIDWPFTNSNAPINGLLHIPSGGGPFPLAVFAHGNHTATEDSTPGYLYLCELLASHGILAATIDVNFLNGGNRGENDGRAIVQLEHIKQFQIWHQQIGHPLAGKVDLSKVMIVGHSRGGEAVGHASLFNGMDAIQFDRFGPSIPVDGSEDLGPYHFNLEAVFAISPTDQQYSPVGGLTGVRDPYMVIHGSRDSDVYYFAGHLAYDRSYRVDLANPAQLAEGTKALLWIHGANHNNFNSQWGQESAGTLTRDLQEQIAKTYIGAVAQAQLLGQSDYLEILQDPDVVFRNGWITQPVTLVSQYQGADRLFIQHNEESGTAIQISAPVTGNVTSTDVQAAKRNLATLGPSSLTTETGIFLDTGSHLLQDAQGVAIAWTEMGGEYRVEFDPATANADTFTHVAFRAGQSFESLNTPGMDQDLTLVFHDGTNSVSFPLSTFTSLPFPDTFPQFRPQIAPFALPHTEPVTVLQTVLIPFQTLRDAGLNPAQLQRIEFHFDLTSSGLLYLDDIQLTRLASPSV
ncbi:alpha/beta hydrolase family protein [Candidatus Entotheonella palauensis]|uniref:alpha/beta hydrolase family protein n=1 Tax=Candidatus Entotheonella palauensis TaxID=93172 RepID=UPI000B7E2F15|nr:hypothetical protein [Candidatus Entotheonella palauensis]